MKSLHVFIFAAAAALLAACDTADNNITRLNSDVQDIAVGDPYPVGARTLAAAMLEAGFNGAEVLKFGPSVRNGLGTSGGAQIREDRYTRALFTIQGGKLYVSSRDGGTFMRDL